MWKTKFGNPTPLREQSDSYKKEDMTADKREYPKKEKEVSEKVDYQKDSSEGEDIND